MAKIPATKIIDEALFEEYITDEEWWDYVNELANNDWSDFDEHPWAWYMERDIRTRDGWYELTIRPDHKNLTVAHWLTENGAEFKYDKNSFLIKDSKHATIVAMRWC